MWLLIRFNQALLINGVDWILYFEPRRPKTEKKNMSAHLAAVQLDSVMDKEEVAHHIVDSAFQSMSALGPGLLESLTGRSCASRMESSA